MGDHERFMANARDAEEMAARSDGKWPREQMQLIAAEWRNLAEAVEGRMPTEPISLSARD